MDHLGEMVSTFMKKKIALHRSKCSALIKHVLRPEMEKDWLNDVHGSFYSLIIDVSTDITTQKQLCLVIPYFSQQMNKIITSFLGLIVLESSTADSIFTTLSQFLESLNLPLKDCIGLATDGCNTMCGRVNSVVTRF